MISIYVTLYLLMKKLYNANCMK